MDLIRVLRQLHFDLLDATVLNGVMQGLLQNTKKAKSDFGRQRTRCIASEVNLHRLSLAEFLAPASDSGDDAQILQLRRLQLMRQRLHVVGNLASSLPQ